MFRISYFLLLVISFTLVACSSPRNYREAKYAALEPAAGPLTPLPGEFVAYKEPSDADLMRTIENYIADKNGPSYTQFEFTRVDLDNDGQRDGIALMKSPHGHWCDLYGCQMVVFKAKGDYFSVISEINPVRGPLVISENSTNGWRDILVRVSGRSGWDAKDVALRFDGDAYPLNPSLERPMQVAATEVSGVRIFP